MLKIKDFFFENEKREQHFEVKVVKLSHHINFSRELLALYKCIVFYLIIVSKVKGFDKVDIDRNFYLERLFSLAKLKLEILFGNIEK